MMLPADYPRSAPFVRIINRNPDYLVDPFYQKLQSKSDKTSFILNEKLNSVKNWHQSNSLVPLVLFRSTSLSSATICSKTSFPSLSPPPRTIPMGAMPTVPGAKCTTKAAITITLEGEASTSKEITRTGAIISKLAGATTTEAVGLRVATMRGEEATTGTTKLAGTARTLLPTQEEWEASWVEEEATRQLS